MTAAPWPTIFAADLVLPVSSHPICDGALLVENGRIAAIGSLPDVEREISGVEQEERAAEAESEAAAVAVIRAEEAARQARNQLESES